MIANLRTPFFIAALVLITVVVLIGLGGSAIIAGAAPQAASPQQLIPNARDLDRVFGLLGEDIDADSALEDIGDALDDMSAEEMNALLAQDNPPGLGIPYLMLVDGVLLFTVGLIGVSLFVGQQVHGRIQGGATLIFSLILLLVTIGLVIRAVIELLLMVSLLVAVPFGTLAYMARYAFFPRGAALAILGLLMTLKIAFGVCLLLAHQRFLQNRGLVLLVATSLLGTIIVIFLLSLVPGFLVSIFDAIAAIIVAILAAIWLIILLIGSIPAVVRALRP
jgi:hypothetical protein